MIPAQRPPITSRSVSREPITGPRGTTTRRRIHNRTTRFSRTGTSAGCAFMPRGHPAPNVRQKTHWISLTLRQNNCGSQTDRAAARAKSSSTSSYPICLPGGPGHENVRCPCAARAKANPCPLRKFLVGRIMAPSAVTPNTRRKRLRSLRHIR